jgi:hypothetical protein
VPNGVTNFLRTKTWKNLFWDGFEILFTGHHAKMWSYWQFISGNAPLYILYSSGLNDGFVGHIIVERYFERHTVNFKTYIVGNDLLAFTIYLKGDNQGVLIDSDRRRSRYEGYC